MTRLEEYQLYHQQVVSECVELMGEDSREFYDKQCTYFDEFSQGIHPRQVAQEQLQAMRELVADADKRKPEKPTQLMLDPNMPSSSATSSKPRRRFRVI